MSNQNIQILELAKQGLTAAEIAEALGYSIEDVEYVLKFDPEMTKALEKANVVAENRKVVADIELDKLAPLAYKVMKELIIGAEKDNVRADLVKFVVEHQLSLKEPKKEQTTNTVIVFNERLIAARERRTQLEQKNTIDIMSAQVTTTA